MGNSNDTRFGLSGAVHTADIERGIRFAQRIESGMIHINDATIRDEPIVAFGGEKRSGLGRLNGEWSRQNRLTLVPGLVKTSNRFQPPSPFR
ncbi:MAG TPA: aldehyde dehydrogenase family protein [Pseudonocardiaceae bacterium]|jgi:aldehyde dehydrogenase (NAD+)|nr:aldehyde dehydrogenase family protein [Pseudonocardiaceae bacterium]